VNEGTLTELRKQLRSVDAELIGLLARRLRLSRKIGYVKQRLNMGVIDPVAEKSAMENFVAFATKVGVEEAYARRVACLVVEGSVEAQLSSRRHAVPKDSELKGFYEKMIRIRRKRRNLIRLDIGEPRFRTPSAIVREARKFLGQNPTILYGSSAGLTELVDAIAARLSDLYGTSVDRSNLLVFPGARFAIFAAIRSIVASLERVAVCRPAWPAYESCAALVGARTLTVPTRLEDHWDIDLTALEEQLKLRPKILVLNYPNNPTGKVISTSRFQEVTGLARKYHATVLSDEVYASYCSSPAPSILEYPDADAIYVNSFSKEFGMTGWRVAYAVAHKQTIAKMRAIVETTLTNVPEFVQRAALAALKDPKQEAARARRQICRRVEMACEELKKADFDFYTPDGGFYVFPRIRRRNIDSQKLAEYVLAKYGVGVLPGTIFGEYPGFLRLAITEAETRVKTGIGRIAEAIYEWAKR